MIDAKRLGSRHKPVAPSARPGAARSLPVAVMSRLPVIGRFARARIEPEVIAPSGAVARLRKRLSLQRLLKTLSKPRTPPPTRSGIPFVSPVIRRVRQPLASTARMVQAAREVRRPKSRWERLREAAQQALADPRDSLRWENLMGLSVALAAGGKRLEAAAAPRRGRVARLLRGDAAPVPVKSAGLGQRLLARLIPKNKGAGPGPRQGRRRKPPKR